MNPSALIEEADLHALVDGELGPERRRKVEDHLLQHPEDAALVESWRRQNAALRAAFEPVALEAPPLALRGVAALGPASQGAQQGPIETGAIHWGRPSGAARAARRLDDVRAFARRKTIVAAIMTLLLCATVAGAVALLYHAARAPERREAAAGAAQSHAARASASYFVYVQDARPTELGPERREELLAWLKARVGFARIPDLAGQGLRFLGGRMIPGVAAPAGLLFYETAKGARVGLYFERVGAGAFAPPPPPVAGYGAIEWRGLGLAFVLIGPSEAVDMPALAERASAETATRDAPAPQP